MKLPKNAHKPMMSEKEIKKRKVWQEKAYKSLKEIKGKQTAKILDKEIIILPGIFAPLWPDSTLLAKAVREHVNEGDVVLDIGTGTGIQGIFAAEKASEVISTDINPKALECARLNAKRFRLEEKIKFIKSDLFSKVQGRFDVIIFNPPFRWFKPRDVLERGELDEDYRTLRKFFSEVKGHLKEGGRILLAFSESGDVKYLEHLIKTSGFKSEVLDRKKKYGWVYSVYELTP